MSLKSTNYCPEIEIGYILCDSRQRAMDFAVVPSWIKHANNLKASHSSAIAHNSVLNLCLIVSPIQNSTYDMMSIILIGFTITVTSTCRIRL